MEFLEDSFDIRVKTAEKFAKFLNLFNIPYLVLSGIENYPERVGRDIDFLISKKDAYQAIYLAGVVKEKMGWSYFFGRWTYFGAYQIFFAKKGKEGKLIWIEFDLILCKKYCLPLGFIPLLFKINIKNLKTHFVGPFPVSLFPSYVKGILRPILYGDFDRFKSGILIKVPKGNCIEGDLRRLMGNKNFNLFAKKSIFKNEEIKIWAKKLKLRLMVYYLLRHPIRAINCFYETKIFRPIFLYFFNSGFSVAIVGPDGVGKSTSIIETEKFLGEIFYTRRGHMRPGILPNPGIFLNAQRKYENPNRKLPNVSEHYLRCIYYWADYFFGYFLKDRYLPKSVTQLKIYDRHAVDIFVNPTRYKVLENVFGVELFRYVPKPNITILLTDCIDSIFKRKKELSCEEISNQYKRWEKLLNKGSIDFKIDVGKTPKETGTKIGLLILSEVQKTFFFKKKFDRFNKNWNEKFQTIFVKNVPRIAISKNIGRKGKKISKRLYQPISTSKRVFYKIFNNYGIKNRFLFSKTIGPPERISVFDWKGFLDFLGEEIGIQPLFPAFYFPPQRDRKKFSLLVFDKNNRLCGYVKIGLDQENIDGLKKQVKAIPILEKFGFEKFSYPV